MADLLGEVGGQITEKLFSGMVWFGIAFILLVVVGIIGYYFFFYRRKFDIKVKVISHRAGDKNKIIWDKAAILKDRKSKTKFFRVWSLKVDLPLPKFNVLQVSSEGDFLEIYRTAEDTFYYLTPTVIDQTQIIKSDGKFYGMASQEAKLIDTDIAYWNVKRKEMNKRMFDTESMFMKLLPYIPIILGGMVMVFMLYILLDHLPAILAELRKLTQELNSLKGADIKTGLLWPLLKSIY